MSGSSGGPGGPYKVQSLIVSPPSAPAPPVALYVPETLLQNATQSQLAAVSQVQLRFAGRVSELLTAAYAEINAIVSQRAEEVE